MQKSAPTRAILALVLVATTTAARAQDAPPQPGAPTPPPTPAPPPTPPPSTPPTPPPPQQPPPQQPPPAQAPQPVTPQGPMTKPPAPAPTALEEATRCFGRDIPHLRFKTGEATWRAGFWGAIDAIAFDDDGRRHDEVTCTDFRPLAEGAMGPFSARIEADLVGVDTPRNLYEAWVAWTVAPQLRISAGQFRVALGSEFATWERDLPFIGYSFPAQIDGRHDVGVRVDGNVTDGFWYQVAGVSGHGFDLEGHRLTSAQISGRAVVHPARLLGAKKDSLWRGLHFGLAAAYLDDGDDPVIVSLPLQTRIFTTPDLGGDEGDWAHLEVGWVHGPFMFGYEQMWGGPNGVAIVGGGEDDFDEMTGFSYSVACNLTGEPRGWKDGAWVPSVGPRPKDGPLSFLPEGRWELGLRYSNGDIDRKLFDNGYTTYAVSSQETRTFSTALFWEPCETFRVGLEWVKTIADDAAAILGDEKRDSSVVLRLEVRF